ncbi:MAG: glycosyltransferase family 4 protein [Candidatus Omnitrophica bacterium]|nr:glycosyltransferase family 4 protein [Candidatus Omnitrophota bacterium]
MRIAIDGHTIGNKRSGDETYTIGLIKALADIDKTNEYIVYVTNDSAYKLIGKLPDNFVIKKICPHNRWIRLCVSYPLAFLKDRPDIIHFQYIAPIFNSAKLVLTIHDVSYRLLPEQYSFIERLSLVYGTALMMKVAKKVLTVSQVSKEQIADNFHIDRDKITVVYNGVPEHFKTKVSEDEEKKILKKYEIKRNYFLYVGNLKPRKKVDELLKGYAELVTKKNIEYDLVIVGRKTDMFEELFSMAEELQISKRVKFLGYVDDMSLSVLYKRAKLFVYPSVFEGFGLPLVEAMIKGVPVICYNGSSTAEVCRDAALKLDEITSKSLADAMGNLMDNEEKRSELIERGYVRAKEFTWEKSAVKTLEVYREVYTELASKKKD